jgi:octaprenyl-diphosphate synthase
MPEHRPEFQRANAAHASESTSPTGEPWMRALGQGGGLAAIEAVQGQVAEALARVAKRFDEQLVSQLPPVAALCEQIERYRGKMLRPTLSIVCGLAARGAGKARELIGEDSITVAAVVEMIHMATLVHDDVLDEAETRRKGRTINRLYGNEAAVILGDYLISSAYHLCSTLDRQSIAVRVGRVSMDTCAGELLQLHHRDNLSLDEATYFEILRGKTGGLIALACRLGAECVSSDPSLLDRLERFGAGLGVAFQIQDDLLDLTGDATTMGKPIGQDLAKGKLTLPVIHHLRECGAADRGKTLRLLDPASAREMDFRDRLSALRDRLHTTGSLQAARDHARELVERAREQLRAIEPSPAREVLDLMAKAVVERSA